MLDKPNLNGNDQLFQVLNGRLEPIQEELGRLGLLPAAESEKVGCLLNLARRLEHQLLEELDGSILLREKLISLQKGKIFSVIFRTLFYCNDCHDLSFKYFRFAESQAKPNRRSVSVGSVRSR